MPHEVLISYSSHDKLQADAICNRLESQGIRCWIAPRDVPSGTEYANSIVKAIELCQVLLLVYSSAAKDSEQVKREVERAVSEGKKILPVRIEDASMSKTFEYYVGSIHWLDAITPPLEKHIDKLAADLKALLSKDDDGAEVVAPAGQSTAAAKAAVQRVAPEADLSPDGGTGSDSTGSGRRPLLLGGGALLAIAAAVVAYFLLVPGTTRVPAVTGKAQMLAVAALKEEGLSAVTDLVADSDYPGGTVISSTPAAGEEIEAKGQVTLTVSGMATVPNLSTKTEEEAKQILTRLGLNLLDVDPPPVGAEVEYVPDAAAAGTVVRSEPAAGSRVMMGETVKLFVAAPRIALPAVAGMPVAEATQLVGEAGLEVSVASDWSPGAEIGTVFKTDPPLPGEVIPGSTVTLYVAARGGWAFLGDDLDVSGIEGSVVPMPRTLNVRTEPQGERLGSISQGTQVRVLDAIASGWAKIVVNE